VSRRIYLLGALALVAVAGAAVYVAGNTDPSAISGTTSINSIRDLPVLEKGPQPSLDPGLGWLNSKPLKAADLKGKVVVYDFWTYSCVNCVRTLPYLEAWHERYAKDGLVIVGVHSPEFEFEKNHRNIAAAVKKLGVTYPVVFDDDMAIWSAFNNQYWPAKYVTDRKGQLRFQHFGEGEYSETESALRVLLGVAKDAARAADPHAKTGTLTAAITPETYLGAERGAPQGQDLSGGNHAFTRPKTLEHNRFALDGNWIVSDQYVESVDGRSQLELRYQGGEVNLVLDRSTPDPVELTVELDGRPVKVVTVDAADLYNLITDGPKGDHTLTLRAGGAGVRAFAFTFGA
jgi:thiol-disulfide isomerase/thioredoxin